MERSSPLTVLNILFAFLVTVVFAPHPVTGEEEWREVGQSKTATRWYIGEPVFASDTDVVSLWVKSVPDTAPHFPAEEEEGIRTILRDIQQRHFGDYDHTEALWEIDCSCGAFRILYFVARDREGGPVASTLTPDAPWVSVIPGSVGERLREVVCSIP